MVCVGFDGLEPTAELRTLLDRGVSSVVLFARNYQSPRQLALLCSSIKWMADHPVLILIDHEGGRVQRFRSPFTELPAMREVGRFGDKQIARQIGEIMARELRAVGIDMNLAPVMDVDSNPSNPVIGQRSFSRDPARVAELGCALIGGLQSAGVAACAKHFPGHGDTVVDSHLDLPRLSHDLGRLQRTELPPFRAAAHAGVAAIMTAHIVFDAIDPLRPATMSEAVITGLLRHPAHTAFSGLVISDDMEMSAIADHFTIEDAALRAAKAGVDLMLVCHQPAIQHRAIDALVEAVRRGHLSDSRIAEARQGLSAIAQRHARQTPDVPLSVIGCDEHRRVIERLHSAASA